MNSDIDKVIDTLHQPLGMKLSATMFYSYACGTDGSINVRSLPKDPFPEGVVSDGQTLTTITVPALNQIIIFRNNVARIGTKNGGKHAGEPLPGYPLNWCELSDFQGSVTDAARVGTGRLVQD